MRTKELRTRNKGKQDDGRTHVIWWCCWAAHGEWSALNTMGDSSDYVNQYPHTLNVCTSRMRWKELFKEQQLRERERAGGVLTPLKSNVNDNKNEKHNSLQAIKIPYVLPSSAPHCIVFLYRIHSKYPRRRTSGHSMRVTYLRFVPFENRAIRAGLEQEEQKLLFESRVSRFTFTIFYGRRIVSSELHIAHNNWILKDWWPEWSISARRSIRW